ncbi:hypothetical protein [Paenibacillus kobensis]|uniref:hypothetical protein n=1 Tax=Paenibacillus kobensis TaxID=59841 RepID=UPI000FD6D2B3|nr:hypothetical protein [Paenibacillus kobensis]
MPNYVPYIILSLLSVLTFLYVMLHARNYGTVVLFLTFVGMIYLFEFIVLVLLDCYVYYPGFVKDPYLDSMIGAFQSNFLAVPVAGIVIVTFRLRYRWGVLFSLFFSGIEWLFLKLGVYEHYWWRTPYTTVSLLFFFWLVRYWSNKIAQGSRLLRYISLLFFSLSVLDTLIFFLMLFGFRRFHLGIYSNPVKDDVFLTFIFVVINALILATVVYRTAAIRWIIAALAVMFALHITLVRTGVIQLYISPWIYYSIYIPCCLLIAWLLVVTKHSLAAMRMHHHRIE